MNSKNIYHSRISRHISKYINYFCYNLKVLSNFSFFFFLIHNFIYVYLCFRFKDNKLAILCLVYDIAILLHI